MKELLKEWFDNNITRKMIVSERIGLLRAYKGYRSDKETVYNVTLDQVIIDPEHRNIKGKGLSSALNLYKPQYDLQDCVDAVRVALFDKTTQKNLRVVMSPFTGSYFKEILNSDAEKSVKIDLISKQLYSFFNGEGGCNVSDISSTILKSCIDYIVDWNKTFKGFSSIEIVQWLLAAKMGTYFNLPIDFRRIDNRKEIDGYSTEKLNKHPLFKLLAHLKFIEGVESPDFSDIQGEYVAALLHGSEKTRAAYCTVIQSLEAALGRLIQVAAQDGVFYLPYNTPNIALKKALSKTDLPWDTCLGRVCAKLSSEQLSKQQQTAILKFLRNISRSSNLTRCDDIPEEYPSDLTKVLKDYQNGKGYQTATGFPFFALKKIIEEHEKNAHEGRTFNPAFLHNATAKRIKYADTRKSSYELNHAKDIIGEGMHDAMRDFLRTKGSRHRLLSITDMVDWLRDVRKGREKFNELQDFSHTMFYDPMDTNVVHKTLHEFYKEKNISARSQNSRWGGLYAFFQYWASSLSVESGDLLVCPVPKPDIVFPLGQSHRSITVRESMPSVLHEKCIEVLSEDNYKICAKTLPSQKGVRVTNQATGKIETINNNTVARCLHLLLLLPIRGKQARWLDEGLLDDHIWDLEKQQYVKNKHPLAQFKYPNGKSHSELYGKSAVLKNRVGSGNDTLILHINTNKTQSYRLAEQGKLGYDIPWPYGTGIPQVDGVWSIIEEQKKFNDMYMHKGVEPIRLDDEEPNIYKAQIREKLPYFVPLFREMLPQVSRANPRERFNLAYPISKTNITKLFKKVLLEAGRRYKQEYPQFEDQNVVKTEDDQWMYDIHSLRVFGVTDLIEKGMPVEVVQMIVGHATSIMTYYYHKLRAETLKELLIKAKRKQGLSLENQKKMYSENDTKGLIALFDLVEEWRNEATSESSRNSVVPNFSGGGVNKVIKGGVCGSFDCDSGGIRIVVHKNGTSVEPSATQGGKFRCGNCRYWRSGPRFILEQIYEINVIAEEIRELRDERVNLIEKSHKVRSDKKLENRSLIAERLDRDVDQKGEILACRVIELGRRQLMLESSLQRVGVIDMPENNLMIPEEFGREFDLSNSPKWEKVNKFNACRELQTQAAVLGLPVSDNEVSMRKIEKFVSRALSVAGESSNPFIFMANDEVKRVALLYAIANSCEKIGREFSDEEFNDPRLLKDSLGIKNMKTLVAEPLSLKKENKLLEQN